MTVFTKTEYERLIRQRRSKGRLHIENRLGNITLEPAGENHLSSSGTHLEFEFLTQLNIGAAQGYASIRLEDGLLRELADMINKFLERPAPPVQVQVLLEQRPRARRRRAEPEQLAGEEREKAEIKAALMGGRR